MSLTNSPDSTTLKFLLRPQPIGVAGTAMENVESLSSWLHRLAEANGLHDPLRSVFGKPHHSASRMEKLLTNPTSVADLARATGRPEDELQMMAFVSPPSAVGPKKPFSFMAWLLRGKAGTTPHVVCPACVGEDSTPYWRKSWRLSVIVDCPVHGIPMVERCEKCKRRFALHRKAEYPLSCCAWCGSPIHLAASKTTKELTPSVWRDFFHSLPYKGQPLDTKPVFDDLAIAMQVLNLLLSYAQAAEIRNDWFHRLAGVPLTSVAPSDARLFSYGTIDERRQALKFVAAVMDTSRHQFHELTRKGDIRRLTLEMLSFTASARPATSWLNKERRLV